MLTVKQLQNIPVDMGSSLSTAIVCDLYLLVVSELGALMLLQLKVTADDLDPRLTVIRQPADLVSCVPPAFFIESCCHSNERLTISLH